MRVRTVILSAGGIMIGVLAAGVATAAAHQSPRNCDSNSVVLTPTRDRLLVRNGDTINYTVSISNVDQAGQTACDLTNATVSLTLPATDGTPTGKKVVLSAGGDVPAGTAKMFLPGPTVWTVNVNPGVVDAVVLVEVNGTLHDAPIDHAAGITKTLGTTVTQPHTTLAVTASPTSGRVPLPVTYTYTEKNDSSTDVPISGVSITDSNCTPVTYQSGDTNKNSVLDTNETWVFTCAKTITQGGVVTSNVVGHGTNTVDNRAVADELASVTMVVSQPHSALTKTASPTSGTTPLSVTYAYTYKNDGVDAITGVVLTDDNCAPVKMTGGDTNTNAVLDVGETWTFTCAKTFATPGTFPNTVTAVGVSQVDQAPVPILTAVAGVVVSTPTTTTSTTIAPAGATPTTTATTTAPRSPSPPTVVGTSGTSPPPTVLGATLTKTPGPGILAFTGKSVGLLLLAGLTAAGLGFMIVSLARLSPPGVIGGTYGFTF